MNPFPEYSNGHLTCVSCGLDLVHVKRDKFYLCFEGVGDKDTSNRGVRCLLPTCLACRNEKGLTLGYCDLHSPRRLAR